jgi:hypothetical protein
MAILAGIVGAATLHLDRDNVYGLIVVGAAGLGIQTYSVHLGTRFSHAYRVEPDEPDRAARMRPNQVLMRRSGEVACQNAALGRRNAKV